MLRDGDADDSKATFRPQRQGVPSAEPRYSPPNPAFKTWNNCPPTSDRVPESGRSREPPLLTPTSAVPDFCYVTSKRARAATRSGGLIAAGGHYRTLRRG